MRFSVPHQFFLQRPLQFCQSLLQLLDGLHNNGTFIKGLLGADIDT